MERVGIAYYDMTSDDRRRQLDLLCVIGVHSS